LDHVSRKEAANTFGLNWMNFANATTSLSRHSIPPHHSQRVSGQNAFLPPRTFTREEFSAFMFANQKNIRKLADS